MVEVICYKLSEIQLFLSSNFIYDWLYVNIYTYRFPEILPTKPLLLYLKFI